MFVFSLVAGALPVKVRHRGYAYANVHIVLGVAPRIEGLVVLQLSFVRSVHTVGA